MMQKHKIIKFGYFMMRQDNLLQERMYHIVIKEQRSFSCSVFAIRVLTLPNQTKVNSAEPKLQVLNSSYIQICTYVAFSFLRILENSLQLTCNVFIMFRACRSAGKNWALSSDNYWALFWLSAVIPTVQTRLSGTRSSIDTWERLTVHWGRNDFWHQRPLF